MRLLGIDFGSKRVGVALSDEEGKFALPHAVFQNDQTLLTKIAALCTEKKIERIVVGESKDLAGKENPIQEAAKVFGKQLAEQTGLLVAWEPEFFTSAEAERSSGKNSMLDASAAALILRSYIAKQNNGNY